MVIRNKLLFLVIILLFLSACSEKSKPIDNSWQKEILYASECGYDGLQCCVDTETPCLYEQECCVDPNDPASTYCSDSCDFGKPNTFCRNTEPKCDEGAVCFDGYCQTAGGNNQPCFSDSSCKEGSVCGNGICVECGLVGNPCCSDPDKYQCQDQDKFDNSRTDCVAGVCIECGNSSKPVCLSEPFCNDRNLENNSICLSCGGYNQPCCKIDDKNIDPCSEENNLECISGFCTKISK